VGAGNRNFPDTARATREQFPSIVREARAANPTTTEGVIMRLPIPRLPLGWPAAFSLTIACAALVGCTTTGPDVRANPAVARQEISKGIDATLSRLYQAAPGSQQLVSRAAGVLVFPDVKSASFVVGAKHGDGALRVKGERSGYYSITGGSIGWQAGAQSKAIVLVFLTPDALAKFRNSNGWTVGADANVAVAKVGANGSIDTLNAQQPVVQFVLNNLGLTAGVSLAGAKISPIRLG
jgi:lipid-binding SYLF domain-containing protein